MWSAARMTIRLCSITTTESPPFTSRRRTSLRISMSVKWSPVVGSSKMNSVLPRFAPRLPAASARCPASLSRCASPPLSVGTGCPIFK